MQTSRDRLLLIGLLAVGLCSIGPMAQADQSELVQLLLSSNVADRDRALGLVAAMGPRNAGPELRQALIDLLEREAGAHTQRYHAGRLGANVKPLENPEFIFGLSRLVIELDDPKAIPALAAALFTGTVVPRALADFGEQAAPAVLRVVNDREAWYDAVVGGLLALRLMVEGQDKRPLADDTLSQIRRAARQRLTGAQYFTTLWQAIDLAAVREDPELMAIVSALAHEPKEVVARGVTDPKLIQRTQQLARDRLAGFPPLPRR